MNPHPQHLLEHTNKDRRQSVTSGIPVRMLKQKLIVRQYRKYTEIGDNISLSQWKNKYSSTGAVLIKGCIMTVGMRQCCGSAYRMHYGTVVSMRIQIQGWWKDEHSALQNNAFAFLPTWNWIHNTGMRQPRTVFDNHKTTDSFLEETWRPGFRIQIHTNLSCWIRIRIWI